MVEAGIFANALSTGARTVNWLESRVLTRLTWGLSLPHTAFTGVVGSGLLDAATAPGSADLPCTDPGPLGFALA